MKLKRLTQTISLMLALVLMLQLIPPTLFGEWGQTAQAAGDAADQGYTFSNVTATDNTVEVEIPNCIVDKTGMVEQSELTIGEEMSSTMTVSQVNPTASEYEVGQSVYPAGISSPYTYNFSDNEKVSLNSGALILNSTDYVLPGVNGLDLVISRTYNSQEANVYTPTLGLDENSNVCTSRKLSTYLTDRYRLGNGWRFGFSSIEKDGTRITLHCADGSSYVVTSWTGIQANFEGYDLDDKILQESNKNKFNNGDMNASYTLTYADGKCEYFSSAGKLIGIQDRFGNTITLQYNENNGDITITDTLNHKVTISKKEWADKSGHTITVALPDGKKLTYEVENHDKGSALYSYTDAVGNTTYYSYDAEDANFNIFERKTECGATNIYLNLTTITHPTNAQTKYTYKASERNLGTNGLMMVYRITAREDTVGNVSYNRLAYTYSENDYSGAPKAPDEITDSFAVTDSTGVTTTTTFKRDHIPSRIVVSNGGRTVQETLYEYNDDKLPIKTTVKQYNVDSGACMTKIEMAEYDAKGNITAFWSSLAEGDKTKTDYKTTYTYHSAYSLLLTQTYKTNADTTIVVSNTLTNSGRCISETTVTVKVKVRVNATNDTVVQKTAYTYDSDGNITSISQYKTLTSSIQTDYTYTDGLLTKESCNGIQTSYAYDNFGRLVARTDDNDNTTSYAYDAMGSITKTTNPDSSTVTYNRSYSGNYVTVTDENGNRIKYTYTPLGQEYEVIDVTTGYVITHKDYDSKQRLIRVKDYIYGSVTEYTYDAFDRVLSETVKQGIRTLSQTLYSYDDAVDGQYNKVTKTVVGDVNAPSVVTTQYTDKHGNVVMTGQFLGGQEYLDTYTFDYAGNVLTHLSAADDANGRSYTAKYEYNGLGQVVKTYNTLGQSTTTTYDMLGRTVETTDYAGTPTTYTYDALGRLTKQTITIETGVTASTMYGYDGAGNLTVEWKPVQTIGSAESWAKTAYTYDTRNRLTKVEQYDGSEVASTTDYAYDGVGNLLSATVGGNTTRYTYDRFGNVLTMTDALGKKESYTYSSLGRLEQKTDRNGVETVYGYDALGRVVYTTTSLGDRMQWVYTLTGQVLWEQNEDQLTEYAYDELGRVITVMETDAVREIEGSPVLLTITLNTNGGVISGSTVLEVWSNATLILPRPTRAQHTFKGWSISPDQSQTYTGSQIIALLMAEGRTEITLYAIYTSWNGGSDVTVPSPPTFPTPGEGVYSLRSTESTSYTKTYTYDLSGNRTSFVLTKDGETVHNIVYQYDALNRLTGVKQAGQSIAAYEYDANGNRTRLTFANGATTFYSYNKANWVISITSRKSGTMLATYAYTYYASGNQKSVTDKDNVVTGYLYDDLGRLTKETETGGLTVAYTYDTAGNRTKMAVSGTETYTTTYTYDANNRLTQENKKVGSTTTTTLYSYDGNGNLTQKSNPNGSEQCTYNGLNQLTHTRIGNTVAKYTYNANGIRISKQVGTSTTDYLLDGGDVVAEYMDDALTASYLRGINLISSTTADGKSYYLHNAHGDVVALTNTSGTVTKRYDYDAFGNEENPSSTDANPFRYCGEYFDKETKTYYLRARYYDPAIARFTQQDTHWSPANAIYGDNPRKINERQDALGLNTYAYAPEITAIMQSGNLYVYCVNNPVMYQDYTGEVLGWIFAGAVVGALVSAGLEVFGQLLDGASLNSLDRRSIRISACMGALSGALGATGVGLLGQTIWNGIFSAVETAWKGENSEKVFISLLLGALGGYLSGPGLQDAAKATGYRLIGGTNGFSVQEFTFISWRLKELLEKEFIKGTIVGIGVDIALDNLKEFLESILNVREENDGI